MRGYFSPFMNKCDLDTCGLIFLLFKSSMVIFFVVVEQLMKEFCRLSTLPSDDDLTESARKLFLQIVDFARQKTKKSTGLLNVLRKLPL